MIKVTTIDNPEYQEFEDWDDLHKTNQVLHSYNDKPSVILDYESGEVSYKAWYLDGKQHRSNDKPSYIVYFESGEVNFKEWHLDGKEYSEKNYKQVMKQIESMSDTEKLLDSRWWVREMVK